VTTASYEHSSGGVDVSTQIHSYLGGQHAFGGDASGDVFNGFVDHIRGSAFADVLEGNYGSGNLIGGDGDDYLIVTRGNDSYYGDEGFDTLDFGNHDTTFGLTINAYEHGVTRNYQNGHHNGNYYTRAYGIEHVVGTEHADVIRFRAGDNVLEGGRGNDTLYGGAGNDIYFVELGGGSDRIYEYGNQGHDTIMVGYDEALSWDGVFIGAGANLSIRANGQLLATAYNSPSEHREQVGVDAVDIGGVGAIDLWYVTGGSWTPGAGSASSNTLRGYGDERGFSLLQGGDGNDIIWSASNRSGSKTYETNSNILHGGRGNDTIYASVGDDQYIFDRGSGRDTVRDTGGLDHIQFGPGVQLEELVFTVVGNDLYIGVAPEGTTDTSDLNANQMSDYMRIVGGGKQIVTHGGSTYSGNLIEYITVQNVNVDIRTLDLDWTIEDQTIPTNPGNPGNPYIPFNPGNLPNIPPIMFDLDGDGLELISVDESRIVVRGDNRSLTRVGWLGADDGFLALDRDGDGKITSLSEVSFAQDLEGAETDLEGLRAYDSNEDGVFDAQDERFGEFKIWQDRNQNGRGGRRELMTLEEAGITSISLDGTSTGNEITDFADNVILNTTEVGMSDGTTSVGYDVALASTVIREGRESATAYIGQSDDVLDGRLGRISVRRLERLLAKQAAKNDTTTVMPIVFDLNGDGELALSHLSESGVSIDVDGNGVGDSIGWVGAEDGLLGLDRDGDGSITAVSEISFVQDLEGAQTDLEGLVAFDSNGDGVLSAEDARFADFRVWQDANQDGVSQSGELRSLEEAGVTSINLTAHVGRQTSDEDEHLDNVVFGHTAVQWADGSETIAGDVGLRVQYAGLTDSETGEDAFITGFAGLEHVHVDSAATMASITLESDWGQIAGGRSPLMAMLYAADAEKARLEALGTDTGLSQDDLLADFDSDEDEEGEGGEADAADTSSDTDATFETETDPYDGTDNITPDSILRVGYELEQHIVHGARFGDMIVRQTLASTVDEGPQVAEASFSELDRFTQAMAGFGAQSAFAGLNVGDKEEGRFNDIIGTQTRSSLMTQLS
jgi:Ca2+-binding RTX toxin-like protein